MNDTLPAAPVSPTPPDRQAVPCTPHTQVHILARRTLENAQDEQQNAERQQAKPFKFVCPLDHHLPQGANQGHLDRQRH